jgi:hypothetical protein
VRNWAHCDGGKLAHRSLDRQRAVLMDELPPGHAPPTAEARAAAVIFSGGQEGRNTNALSRSLMPCSKTPTIWSRRRRLATQETYPRRPSEVVAFLVPRKSRPSRLLPVRREDDR